MVEIISIKNFQNLFLPVKYLNSEILITFIRNLDNIMNECNIYKDFDFCITTFPSIRISVNMILKHFGFNRRRRNHRCIILTSLDAINIYLGLDLYQHQ